MRHLVLLSFGLCLPLGCGEPAANPRTENQVPSRPSAMEFLQQQAPSLSPDDQRALELGRKVLAAERASSEADIFVGMGPITVKVTVNDAMTNVVDADELLTKLELSMRRNNIPLSTNGTRLTFAVFGMRSGEKQQTSLDFFTCSTSLKAETYILAAYQSPPHFMWASVWDMDAIAMGKKEYLKDTIPNHIESFADKFAVQYLRANTPSPAR